MRRNIKGKDRGVPQDRRHTPRFQCAKVACGDPLGGYRTLQRQGKRRGLVTSQARVSPSTGHEISRMLVVVQKGERHAPKRKRQGGGVVIDGRVGRHTPQG